MTRPQRGTRRRRSPAAGLFEAARRAPSGAIGRALIVFYRSYLLADDAAPVIALADALAADGLEVEAIFVTSLKDGAAIDFARGRIAAKKPDVILNATAFSSRLDDGASVLDEADAPVLQAIFAGVSEERWRDDPRGLGAADLAMNIVLPEMDGRLIARAIAFKAPAPHRPELQFTPLIHEPAVSRVKFVADLAAAWVKLRKTPARARKIACILSDYPGKAGAAAMPSGSIRREASPRSPRCCGRKAIAVGALPPAEKLMASLESTASERLSLAEYEEALRAHAAALRRGRHGGLGRAGSRRRRARRRLCIFDSARRKLLSGAAAGPRLGA